MNRLRRLRSEELGHVYTSIRRQSSGNFRKTNRSGSPMFIRLRIVSNFNRRTGRFFRHDQKGLVFFQSLRGIAVEDSVERMADHFKT